MIIDAIGGVKLESDLIDRMVDAGVHVSRFRPVKAYAAKRLANRTHRKILVADGSVGLTGGVGIAEEWTGDAQDPDHWRDTHVRVRGPVVRGLFGAFAENWLEATGEVLAGDDYLPALEQREDGGPMMVVRSSAGVGDTNVEALYYLAIAAAQERIDLTAAYFAPRPAFIEALEDAAERGVRVRVLVPGPEIDKPSVRMAGRAAYDQLLDAGIEIFEYQPTMLHAKTMVVDDIWSAVGSVNFDNRSFQLNDEATLCVQSAAFAGELTEQFEADLEAVRADGARALEAARAAAPRAGGGVEAGAEGTMSELPASRDRALRGGRWPRATCRTARCSSVRGDEVLIEERNTVVTDGDISAHPEFKLALWASRELLVRGRAARRRCTRARTRARCARARSRAQGSAAWCSRSRPSSTSRSRRRSGRRCRTRARRCSKRRACRSTATTTADRSRRPGGCGRCRRPRRRPRRRRRRRTAGSARCGARPTPDRRARRSAAAPLCAAPA